MKKKLINYEKEQLDEQEEINWWLRLNTIFTILAGIANLIIAVVLVWLAMK